MYRSPESQKNVTTSGQSSNSPLAGSAGSSPSITTPGGGLDSVGDGGQSVDSSASRSATRRATRFVPPLDCPTRMPSSRARRRHSASAASMPTVSTLSTRSVSRMSETKPGPIPWKSSLPASPVERTALSSGSTATTSMSGYASSSRRAVPEIVPPVPTPATKASGSRSPSWSTISTPVVR